MIRSKIFKNILTVFIFCGVFTSGMAAPVENTVLVEINTTEMTNEEIENVIAEPIQILLGSLEDVLMVYAKYRTNQAIIDVKFIQEPADTEALVSRVKTTINSYMEKLPESINSISVSLGDPSEILATEDDDTKPETEVVDKDQKKNRNNSASTVVADTDEDTPETLSDSVTKDQLGVIRSVEKRYRTGRYLGSIESSNEYLPVITTLIPASSLNDDVAGGKYFMNEQDEIIVGKITDCYNNSGNVLTCQWRDKYGTGGVDFIFTPDYTSFNGRWSINGKEGAYKWSGIKVKDK